jgi:hypothetical protein
MGRSNKKKRKKSNERGSDQSSDQSSAHEISTAISEANSVLYDATPTGMENLHTKSTPNEGSAINK